MSTRIGVVGLGYWGPNLARNFDRLPGAELRWICDQSQEARERFAPAFREARVAGDVDELLGDPDLGADQVRMLQRTISECGAVEEIEAMIADNVARATAVLEEAPISRDARAELGSLARAVTRRTS